MNDEGHASRDSAARVLFVCTANRARSPMAEMIARDLFDRAALAVDVSSAGFLEGGRPAEPEARRVASKRGLDLGSHTSRQLDQAIVDASDLILTMTSTHVLDICATWPDAASRTFALGEVARFDGATATPDAGSLDPEALRGWAASLAAKQRPGLLGGEVDIADPMGRGLRAFRRTAEEIDRHLGLLVELLTGSAHR